MPDAEEAHLAEAAEEVAGKLALLVPLPGVGSELLLREVADDAPEGLVLVGERLEGDGGGFIGRSVAHAAGASQGGGTTTARCPRRVAQATPATETPMPRRPTAVHRLAAGARPSRNWAMGVSCSQDAASPTESEP